MSLIAWNPTTRVNSRGHGPLQSKHKALTALLPYAILQERDGKPKMLDIFLRSARSSKEWELTWHQFGKYASGLLYKASPRAVVLMLPYIQWDWLKYRKDWIQRWAWAVSTAPDTKRVTQSVVDTLLQIASKEELLPYIPVKIWSWLTKRPPLPAVCLGRNVGTCAHVVKAVQALKDIEVLKSYFLLVWSEWSHFSPDSASGDPPSPNPSLFSPLYIHRSVHATESVLNHHIFSSSTSVPDHPASRILDSPSSHHLSSSSNSSPSGHTPNNPNSVSVRPPPSNNTPGHHSAHITDNALSRRMSINSDSTPSSPPLQVIPIDMPIRCSPPPSHQ
jgi:hypothetical protein